MDETEDNCADIFGDFQQKTTTETRGFISEAFLHTTASHWATGNMNWYTTQEARRAFKHKNVIFIISKGVNTLLV